MKCSECGGRIGPFVYAVGMPVHPSCVPAPAGRLARTAEPPPDCDLRRARAERIAVPPPARRLVR